MIPLKGDKAIAQGNALGVVAVETYALKGQKQL